MTTKEARAIDCLFAGYLRAAAHYQKEGDHDQERIAQEGIHCLRMLANRVGYIINTTK